MVPAGGSKGGQTKAGGLKWRRGVRGGVAAPSDQAPSGRGHADSSQLQQGLLQALHKELLQNCFAAADPPCAALQDAITDSVAAEAAEAYRQRLQKGLGGVCVPPSPPLGR